MICRKFFGLKDAKILCEDNGALPFVLAARFELAVKRLFPDLKKEYLLPFHEKNLYSTKKDQLRRSRLYLPGNEPKFFVNAGLHSPDGIILDLKIVLHHQKKMLHNYLFEMHYVQLIFMVLNEWFESISFQKDWMI